MNGKNGRLDLATVRARLSTARGRDYWRSLEELADHEGIRELLQREFPDHASTWMDPVGRREFLKLMGASLALAGLAGCGSPAPTNEKIVPYVRAPEEMVPGKPLFFATAMTLGGFATGLLVESHEGRPTKVEGNPEHPASLGATDAFAQASVLTLYDPDRSQVVTKAGRISTWNAFFAELNAELETQRLRRGAGLRLLTETVTSPTLASQIKALLAAFPKASWHQYEPAGRDAARAGARLAFGEDADTHYRLDRADVILALDADFLASGPGCVRYARDFAARRRVRGREAPMNRLYVVESTPSCTGSMADYRLPLRPGRMEEFARALARGLGLAVGPETGAGPSAAHAKWTAAVVRDLQRHPGASVVLAGEEQPPLVHALAHGMNHALENVGHTVIHTDPVEVHPVDHMESLRELVRDMEAGVVDVLVILGGNPVFTAPADMHFAERLAKVGLRVHLSLYEDETSALCHWHVPAAHDLESWSDARAYDGTVTILQPLIAPLYNGKTAHELLAGISGQPDATGHDIVRGYWNTRHPGKDFDQFWRTALQDGVVAGTSLPPKRVTVLRDFPEVVPAGRRVGGGTASSQGGSAQGLEIVFRPDPTIFDGRFANNGWLQELPKPLTKLTWDNAALLSPATAERLGLTYRVGTTGGEHGRIYTDLVELKYQGRKVRAPAWILPGQPDGCVTVHLGHGRTRAGRVGTGTGFNAYALRTSEAPWGGPGLEIRRTGEQYPLACTQFHHNIEGRHLVRAGTIEEYRKNPQFAQQMEPEKPGDLTMYPGFPYEGYAWGMAIDLNACTGCGACVVACQAENNIPIVGKTEVTRGREMHWIRIDRYYRGGLENPETYHQPVPCMHCENAPCELVCPVQATNHSAEGLNDMVYNRCVGTRYCSNNCPYKVRRFNFFQYADFKTPSLKLLNNPNVTVRSRGVMEKCTYCVQRINVAKIRAEEEDRQVRDGEILTACQQACPTQAIVFGNINDPESRVAKLKADSRNYSLLTSFLNTRPRTTYLARLRNPNPEIETE
jgi:molybdopterin-containing oxidoreductase family iron-sulfur binding subunit